MTFEAAPATFDGKSNFSHNPIPVGGNFYTGLPQQVWVPV